MCFYHYGFTKLCYLQVIFLMEYYSITESLKLMNIKYMFTIKSTIQSENQCGKVV